MRNICLALFLLIGLTLQAQEPKAKSGTFALTDATLVTVTNGTLKGSILIQDGKITAIGEEISIPDGTTVISCAGKYVYPGLIDGGTQLGLSEVGSVSLTQDYDEVGDINPHAQALTAVNPNAVAIPITRTNGITTVIAMPSGGIFPGTAALINLYGYSAEQMYAGFKGMRMYFPSTARRGRWDRRSDEDIEKQRKKRMAKMDEVWKKVGTYARIDSLHKAGKGAAPGFYPEMAALVPVLKGEMPLMIEVNSAKDIEAAIKWVEEKGFDAIFTGVAEGWRVAEQLAEAKIPVIVGPMLSLPTRGYDRYDRPYANPGIMQQAGVKVAIRTSDTENVRNLPFNAGFAAAYGMGKEEALKAITIIPAEIFGVDEQLGSLEVGKSANLFVTDGDPFETKTQVYDVFINGWQMPMSSRQIRLYEEFLERTPGVGNE